MRSRADCHLLRTIIPRPAGAMMAPAGHWRWSYGRAIKRELIEPTGDKRYIRREEKGRIKESDDVGRSLAADRRTKAKTVVKSGQGDKRSQRLILGWRGRVVWERHTLLRVLQAKLETLSCVTPPTT
jgi:hypothetical protein